MSVSVLVHCPSCHAEGNLADPTLFGKSISCPVCQQVFVVPLPESQMATPTVTGGDEMPPAVPDPVPTTEITPPPATPMPVVAEVQPAAEAAPPIPVVSQDQPTAPEASSGAALEVATSNSPSDEPTAAASFAAAAPMATAQPMPIAVAVAIPIPAPAPSQPAWPVATVPVSPTPPVTGDFLLPERPPMEGPVPAFMAPAPVAGAAEETFAQSLPTPGVRGSVQPPKLPSKTVQMVIIGSVSAILLFATVMFLAGDPMRSPKPKLAKSTAKEKPVEEAPSGESIENVFERINASSKPKDK